MQAIFEASPRQTPPPFRLIADALTPLIFDTLAMIRRRRDITLQGALSPRF